MSTNSNPRAPAEIDTNDTPARRRRSQELLVAGSEAGAERACVLYSILASRGLHGVDPFATSATSPVSPDPAVSAEARKAAIDGCIQGDHGHGMAAEAMGCSLP